MTCATSVTQSASAWRPEGNVTRTVGMARVIVVQGLAGHAYAELPVQHLRDNGYDASLLQPPAWRGVEHDLERYGRDEALRGLAAGGLSITTGV